MTSTTAPIEVPSGLDRPGEVVDAQGERTISTATGGASLEMRASWERPAFAALVVGTGVLYLWNLSASGWANSFYAAAAQAGSKSWAAWFFGSSDAANSITVDKPPASLWASGLAVRIFGLNSWSILVPQALMGVATVGLVAATVRRHLSARAAMIAGLTMALTPIAALMFRYNNPDALLTMLMTAAAYTLLRGVEDGRRRWIVVTGALIGVGFLAKQLQVLLVVPPLALAYLVAAPLSIRRRLTDLIVGGAAIVAAAGWWIAIVELVPTSARPYIGGSQDNSILELTLGYNGLGRLTGDETGSVGGGGPGGLAGGGMWGRTGMTRLFDDVIGGQIAWLVPAALVVVVVGLWLTRRFPRTDRVRAMIILWGGWLVVTMLVFSHMEGIFHEYYTVALAPAIAALVGIGADLLWRRRTRPTATVMLGTVVALTALWSAILLGRAPDWNPWLRPVVLGCGVVVGGLMIVTRWLPLRVANGVALAAVAVCLAGPTAWTLQTVVTPYSGAIVTAGPAVSSGVGPGGLGGPGGRFPPAGDIDPENLPTVPGGGAMPDGGPIPGGNMPDFGGAGGIAGLLDATEPSDGVIAALADHADDYVWVAATIGSTSAASFQLATEQPVMSVGGFNGSDPSPTLQQFQRYVADGQIHWFIGGGGFGTAMGGSDESASISEWVTANFAPVTIDGMTMYDLTTPVE
jgi:4-amino-4-deoxy-L-arabinose transferase-like glycosyltransferase